MGKANARAQTAETGPDFDRRHSFSGDFDKKCHAELTAVVTDESGKTYNTAVSFVDVGSTPEFACAIPFRVPTGTMLKSLQIDAATLEIPAGKH